jgi:3-oxoacyl-[acyl-carrier protein] reductase
MSPADGNGRPEGCALVTGAARGIGAATARALAADGWAVGVNYRSDAESAEQLVDEITAAGGTAMPIQGDVCDADDLDAVFAAMEAEHGPVLVLVNNAGIRADGLAPQLDDDAWASVVETNLSAAFRATRRALRPMLRARFGRIINVASVVGPRANAGQANYAAAKAGLIGMTRTVAVEVARRGITVNAVAPGFVETRFTADVNGDALGEIPARRAGTPDEVAACVRFLASDAASYVTGTTLTVDGGLSA